MKTFHRSFKINISILIFIGSIVVIATVWFINTNNEKLYSILGGLATGLIIAVIQFIITWFDHAQIEKLKKLELKEIMYNRDDRNIYEKYIEEAQTEISVMGVTAKRFFDDFADCDSNATQNAKVLLHKMGDGLKVRVLVPNMVYLNDNKKTDFEKVKQHVKTIKEKFPTYHLEIRYFEHLSSHSIFIIDDTCIVGPVFPKVESKYTPALYLGNSSPFAKHYLDYFDDEWETAHG
jgi:hypothetical protein